MKTKQETKTKALMLRCETELYYALEEIARKNDRSLSSQVRTVLRAFIARQNTEPTQMP